MSCTRTFSVRSAAATYFGSCGLAALFFLTALLSPGPLAPAAEGFPRHLADVSVTGPEDLSRLAALGLDVAGVNRGKSAVQIVASDDGLALLSSEGFSYTLREAREAAAGIPLALSDYTDPQEMSAFMDQVQASYPSLARKVVLQGTLFEGQKLYAMKITKDVDLPNDRPAFVLDAQHHAREVMTAEIAKDAMDYLTSRYATDSEVKDWVDHIVIWIVPCANPDGAEYVFQHDSWWRKNRHPSCPVDTNRNYSFLWNACGGSSGSCTSETYRGTTPDSEPETQGMAQLFEEARAFFGLSYHSFGEYLMYSYGCADPSERAAMDLVASGLNAVLLNDDGIPGQYAQGPIWSTIYKVDGGSTDSEYGRFGTYAYSIEVNCCDFQPDYAAWRDKTVQRQRTAWQYFLDRTLAAPQVRGKVTDAATGLPLRAQVGAQEVVFAQGEIPRTADSRGMYHWLAAPNGTLHLSFSMPGYCTETRTATVGTAPLDLNVALTPVGLPAPSGLTASPACPGVALAWNPAPGASAYSLYRATGSCPGSYALVASDIPGTAFTDSTATEGILYAYTVRAISASSCESPASPCASATAASAPAGPSAPVFSGVTSTSAKLAWTAIPGAASYDVHRAQGTCSSAFTLRVAGVRSLSWTDTGLAPSTLHSYFVVARNECGSGPDGECASFTTAAPPCMVTCSAQAPASAQAGTAVPFSSTATLSGSCEGEGVWQWNFGDGTLSAVQNPEHAYAQPGDYWWTVTITSGPEACSESGSIRIDPPCTLDCEAATAPASGTVPLDVAFTASITASHCAGDPSYAWTFGDGQASSEASPHHRYEAPGTFAWTLAAAADGATCSRSGTVIVEEPCTLACEASAAPSGGIAPLEVSFAASAIASHCLGSPAFAWAFGDGQTSTEGAPLHLYQEAGTYAWTLTVTADTLACTKAGTVTASEPCTLSCEASADPASGKAPLEVAFSGTALTPHCPGTPGYAWSFGDGHTSGEPSPSHTYATEGSYTWTLTVTQEGITCTRTGTLSVEERLPGDTDGNGTVSLGEVQQAINMFLDTQAPLPPVDCDGDGEVSIGEVQKVVNAFLGLESSCQGIS